MIFIYEDFSMYTNIIKKVSEGDQVEKHLAISITCMIHVIIIWAGKISFETLAKWHFLIDLYFFFNGFT